MQAVALDTGCFERQSDIALWRKVLSALVILSFFSISYASQTHIHGRTITQVAASVIAKSMQIASDHQASKPIKNNSDDPADCPLCQAVSLAGVAILPILIAILLFQNTVSSILPRLSERLRPSRLSFVRQPRGPPIL
ncbi:MAG TPA: DUF2946 family protein [Rhizomicrobium sp.]|nr:DUF2946 family protein [Rhizomicrobium sp.]